VLSFSCPQSACAGSTFVAYIAAAPHRKLCWMRIQLITYP
jgi:hypothetical protein